jgi:uncharacterized membrane protein YtjA (UPF0391 family)
MGLLSWALLALVISLIAGAFGFNGVSQGASTISKVLFGLFLVAAVILFVMAMAGVSLVV